MSTPETHSPFRHDVVVIGGGGHVGLPLAIALADSGASVAVYDVSAATVEKVNAAVMPFSEPGAQPKLDKAIRDPPPPHPTPRTTKKKNPPPTAPFFSPPPTPPSSASRRTSSSSSARRW